MKLSHKQRINHELQEVGVSRFGMMKFSVRYLHHIVHEDEHIKAIVYGRYQDKDTKFNWNEGLLLATDKRVMFVDHKPGYTMVDELTYDIVSGVTVTKALFSAVILHTRMGDYEVRFVNDRCAEIFSHYVEIRRLIQDPAPSI